MRGVMSRLISVCHFLELVTRHRITSLSSLWGSLTLGHPLRRSGVPGAVGDRDGAERRGWREDNET
jgi:hypothetical protein